MDRFVLEMVDDSPASSESTTLTTTSSLSTGSLSPTTSPSFSTSPTVATTIGVAIGGFALAVISIIVGFHCRRHRKHRNRLVSRHGDIDANARGEVSSPAIVPYPLVHPSLSKEERPKAGETRIPQRPPSPTPSFGNTAIVTYRRLRRRDQRHEVDAGPISVDGESTLPPLYEQVFRAGPSNCPEPNNEL
ncbi:hypothetical protein PQX77_010977 [Marasmius sp. AFHP31]|nr:hypothetical protein PQX77_010977 [Marasmius sp. AFHP31]